MSLYDDIEPTVKRPREESSVSMSTVPRVVAEKKNDKLPSNMFAPRNISVKKPGDNRAAPSKTIGQPVYRTMDTPLSLSNVQPTAQPQAMPPTIDLDAVKAQIAQKRLEIEKTVKGKMNTPAQSFSATGFNSTIGQLKAHKVDMSKIQGITNVVPNDVKDDSVCLFDEVHIIDEYNPIKPNNYLDFMRSINCNPAFGEEVDDSKLDRLIMEEIINGQEERERSPSPEPEQEIRPKGAVAANIMAKMGYKHGSGLGRHGQGMSTALRVEKRGGHGGKIISEIEEVMFSVGINPEEFTGTVSNVVVLKNIYTNDDLPEDYETEMSSELSNFGAIHRLYVHRQPQEEDPMEQVRVFVEYVSKASAIRAYANLNTRCFSMRQIRAFFYPPERFALGHYSDYV